LNLNEKIKSNILKDFDNRLREELATDLYSFIATVKLDEGESFHDAVDVIFNRDGATGLRNFLEALLEMIEGFKTTKSNSEPFNSV
jgi:hypothetical protein